MKTESVVAGASSYMDMTHTLNARCINALALIDGDCKSPVLEAQPAVQPHPGPKVSEILKRLPTTEDLEPVFSRLRGVDLILATLSYGLGVRVSDLQGVRVRDVHVSNRMIVIGGVARPLPLLVVDDLRDHIHEKLCGSDASVSVSKREQRVFSDEDLRGFFKQLSEYQQARISEGREGALLTEPCLNRIFRVLGRFHSKRATGRGARLRSPLELFDKGPRIVRRGRWGVVDAYYLWRTAYPGCA